ncbi:hypothetical protein T484DRAFT_1836933, partial [Baffinella frigidus]
CEAGGACARSGALILAGEGGASWPPAPSEAGRYRVCVYSSVGEYGRGAPLVCSSPFEVRAGSADACGECGGYGGADSHCSDPYALQLAGELAGGVCAGETLRLEWSAPSNHPTMRIKGYSSGFPCRVTFANQGVGPGLAPPGSTGCVGGEVNSTGFPCRVNFANQGLVVAGFKGCGEACTSGEVDMAADWARLWQCATVGMRWMVHLEALDPPRTLASVPLEGSADCGSCDRWRSTPLATTTGEELAVETTPGFGAPLAFDAGKVLALAAGMLAALSCCYCCFWCVRRQPYDNR